MHRQFIFIQISHLSQVPETNVGADEEDYEHSDIIHHFDFLSDAAVLDVLEAKV